MAHAWWRHTLNVWNYTQTGAVFNRLTGWRGAVAPCRARNINQSYNKAMRAKKFCSNTWQGWWRRRQFSGPTTQRWMNSKVCKVTIAWLSIKELLWQRARSHRTPQHLRLHLRRRWLTYMLVMIRMIQFGFNEKVMFCWQLDFRALWRSPCPWKW